SRHGAVNFNFIMVVPSCDDRSTRTSLDHVVHRCGVASADRTNWREIRQVADAVTHPGRTGSRSQWEQRPAHTACALSALRVWRDVAAAISIFAAVVALALVATVAGADVAVDRPAAHLAEMPFLRLRPGLVADETGVRCGDPGSAGWLHR